MSKFYTIYAKNLYVVAATLVHMRIPFTFRPHKMFNDKTLKSPYKRSTIDLELDEERVTMSDVLYEMNNKYGDTFEFEILSETNG